LAGWPGGVIVVVDRVFFGECGGVHAAGAAVPGRIPPNGAGYYGVSTAST
jgi:hypothetical protein